MTGVGTRETKTTERTVPGRWLSFGLRLAGAGLLIATASVHLDLYLTGFRNVHVIGWLFLFQVIAAFGLAAIVLVTGGRLAAAAGGLFALSTLGGYLLTVWVGLFGFREVRTTAGIVAGVLEVAAFAVLAAYSLAPGRSPGVPRPSAARIAARAESATPLAARGAVALTIVAAVLLVVGLTTAGAPQAAAAGGMLRVATIGGVRVITNSQGLTLYSFGPDSPTASKCYGSCATYWPPVKGPVTAGPGVTGTLGTIRRTDGTLQATYDGHPLYTWVGDKAPGQATGNKLNLNGGLWLDVPVSG